MIEKLSRYESVNEFHTLPALFENQEEYEAFQARHAKADVAYGRLEGYKGRTWIGIDAGSTTVKAVVIGENREILDSTYLSNSGNPVPIVREYLSGVYERCPDIRIAGSCVTGYGEDIIKNAFSIDQGLVETMAHLRAAQEFMPDVEFIIVFFGEVLKCFIIYFSAIVYTFPCCFKITISVGAACGRPYRSLYRTKVFSAGISSRVSWEEK